MHVKCIWSHFGPFPKDFSACEMHFDPFRANSQAIWCMGNAFGYILDPFLRTLAHVKRILTLLEIITKAFGTWEMHLDPFQAYY